MPTYDDGTPSGPPAPSIWTGPGAVPRRLYTKPDIDRPIFRIPTGEREPESDPPQTPIWINSNKPGFTEPPLWARPFSRLFIACVPWYRVATTLGGCFTVPHDRSLIIRGVSYEALNAVQYDTFQFDLLVNNMPVATLEDMRVDTAIANPAQQNGLAGHFRPMPINLQADHDATVCVRGTLLGPITITGAPVTFAGNPILTSDCQMKVILYGWLAPLREAIDGGPRPTDLGDMDFSALEDDQSRGGFP